MRRVLLWLIGILLAVLGVVTGVLVCFHVPQNASGMAAKGVCSAAFVAGRPLTDDLMAQDVAPASGMHRAISTRVDESDRTVTAKFLGLFPRTAALVTDRGCVLDLAADPESVAHQPATDKRAWPQGETTVPKRRWGDEVEAGALERAVDAALVGAGDPAAANARGVAVVHEGRLLILEETPGFARGTALHGWSMAKTVTAMLTHKVAAEKGIDLDAAVIDSFPKGREPAWVDAWRTDERSHIRISDLLYMRDGLDNTEDYQPWGSVPQMLYGEPDMAAWAAEHPAEERAGSRWRYLSATTNILSAVVRAQFPTDAEYWRYADEALFEPIGATSATLETDTSGTWVGAAYLWASLSDWARLGQLMLQDGTWEGKPVLPPGWLDLASTPAMRSGEGRDFGAHTWRLGDPEAGHCRANPEVPEDTLAMVGRWGQIVAMVPSRDAVVVRLGWTIEPGQFDDCGFLGDVLAALPK
ncbi:MAG: serine hydrolase [Candidatus Nanopelagicales bacterium]